MLEQTEQPIAEPVEKLDPYGDVALGVECAWPVSIPEAKDGHDHPLDAR
jgi:hypothetical protein